MNCSSSPVPSVATTSACVSPRVNSAEPCVRGSTCTSETIGRTVFRSRPSMRRPVLTMSPRTMSVLRSLKSVGEQHLLGRRRRISAPAFDLALAPPSTSVVALLLLRGGEGGAQVGLGDLLDLARCTSAMSGSLMSHGSLAAFSASLMIACITGWKPLWPNMTASSICFSGSSLASDLDHHHRVLRAGDDEVERRLPPSRRASG